VFAVGQAVAGDVAGHFDAMGEAVEEGIGVGGIGPPRR